MEMAYVHKKQKTNWREKEPPYQVGKDEFTIFDVERDYDGWADATLYRPLAFELVVVQTETKKKRLWWDGNKWDGLRIAPEDKVLYWKTYIRIQDEKSSCEENEESHDRVQGW